jgi:hypothetical protein
MAPNIIYILKGNLPDGSSQHWSEVTASSLIGLDKSGNVVEEGNLVSRHSFSHVFRTGFVLNKGFIFQIVLVSMKF